MRIGITCNLKNNESRLSSAYVRAVANTGAVPFLLPVCGSRYQWQEMLNGIDGLLLSGGGDPDAWLYGEDALPGQGYVQPERDAMELYLARRSLDKRIPLLGICRGAQIMAVAAGGTLHLDGAGVQKIQHQQRAPRSYPIHKVKVRRSSLLRRILQTTEIRVNSLHHQAVKQPGRFVVSAVAPDGVTEGIELPGHLFALGVQWHPEWLADDYRHGQAIFEALLVAAQKKRKKANP
ncbi:MAG: Gamma-glutamyl-gamma-aminobutyrate hydrolase PuuD [Dehalococcoidia bacterium]|nr:Gamma-glutamyl-gamma-aminobutyrate hydrolase PuuD [Bacillota bacterium]MBT9143657.1 Gamma-glutamyl-gamma-aminobutyrate hydrolase PuuD [Bacillota bacterium]